MIYIGSDHRGFEFKEKLGQELAKWGFDYEDLGPLEYNQEDDYPLFARLVAEKVVAKPGSRGILICGSGVGIAVAANKIKGIRAGTVVMSEQAVASVSDEDLNVLALSANFSDDENNFKITKAFIESKFSGAERHVRRLEQIKKLEN